MFTYEQALAKAKKAKGDIDAYVEYKNAYVFYNSKAKGTDAVDGDVTILKSNGNVVAYAEYVIEYPSDTKVVSRGKV